jgi:hypothetical protein
MILFKLLAKKLVKDGASQFQNSCEFSESSLTLLYEISTVGLGARWVPKIFTGAYRTQRMASPLTLLERYHKDGDDFLNRIVRVTGDETWVSFVNVETKEQSKHWMNTHSPNKAEKFKLFFLLLLVG